MFKANDEVLVDMAITFYGEGTHEVTSNAGDRATILDVEGYFEQDGVRYMSCELRMESGPADQWDGYADIDLELIRVA